VRHLINQEDVDFRALVTVDRVFVFAMAEVNLAAIPEPDFVVNDGAKLRLNPGCQQVAVSLRPFGMWFFSKSSRMRRNR
jgi:hypothetical protein